MKWKLLRNSTTDQRVWQKAGDEKHLYFADHSGDGDDHVGRPDETDDGPLAWKIPTKQTDLELTPSRHATQQLVGTIKVDEGYIGICHPLAFWLERNYPVIRVVLRLGKRRYILREVE